MNTDLVVYITICITLLMLVRYLTVRSIWRQKLKIEEIKQETARIRLETTALKSGIANATFQHHLVRNESER